MKVGEGVKLELRGDLQRIDCSYLLVGVRCSCNPAPCDVPSFFCSLPSTLTPTAHRRLHRSSPQQGGGGGGLTPTAAFIIALEEKFTDEEPLQ